MNKEHFLRITVLVLALLQPVASYLSDIGSSSNLMDQMSNPTITPAGYAFGIWGVITVGSLLYALYQMLPARRNRELYDTIAPYSIAVFAGFSVWLYAADKNWLVATVLIFIGMGYALYRLFPYILNAQREGKLSWFEQIATYGTFGLYAGWTTVAIFANIASALKFSGVSDVGNVGLAWQTIVLLAATSVALLFITKTKGSTPYAATIVWAFVAVAVGTIQRGEVAGFLPWVAGAATFLIIGQYIRLFLAGASKKSLF